MLKHFYILALVFVVACTSNTIFEKPKDLISKETMTDLLTDMYYAKAARTLTNKSGNRNIDYTILVYKKYGVDSAQFSRSNFYYTSKIDEYEKIHTEVQKRIQDKLDEFNLEKKLEDSIALAKKELLELKKDPLKKVESKNLFLEIPN